MALPPERELLAATIAFQELLVAYEELAGRLLRADPVGGRQALQECEQGIVVRLARLEDETALGTGGGDILAAAADGIRTALLNARSPGAAKARQQ